MWNDSYGRIGITTDSLLESLFTPAHMQVYSTKDSSVHADLAENLTPQRYIRSEKERPNDFFLHQTDIPIIDMDMFLSDSERCRQKEIEKLGIACEQWGFFQAINHGIPLSMMERMKKILREFVQLPLEEKLKYEMQDAEGYSQLFVASDDQTLDWADILFLTTLPTENRNMKFWPNMPADFRETVDQYALEIQMLCKTIFCLLSEKIGLKPNSFIKICGEMEQAIRMNYYPSCPRPDLVLGISPHADGSTLTALLQDDDTVGLQISKDGKWVPIQPIPGALVINIGDVLEILSNGKYKSIEHRAVTNIDKDRVSIAMFYTPSKEAELGPAPELINELNPCRYRTFIHEDYMGHFFCSKLEGKACLQFVRIK